MVRFALRDGGYESPGDVRQVHAHFRSIRIDATDEIVLLVSHHPRARRIPVIPPGCVAEVSGFHGAVVVVAAVDLSIAVIEAAAGIVVSAVDDPVLPLSLIVDCGAFRVVLPEAHSRLDEYAVHLVSHDCDWRHVGDGKIVEPTQSRAVESATRCLDRKSV